jgi:uncharacterized alpha-E superfamily protein
MLSRVANNLYWMSRYIERTENTARLVDASQQLLLDSRRDDDADPARHWRPVLDCTGDEGLFESIHSSFDTASVTDYLVFDQKNPNAILSSVIQARENARTVRDQLTSELWESINRLYLFATSREAPELLRSSPADFFQEIKTIALLIQSLTDATVVRNEGWNFIQAGRYLERADQTSRLLDVRHASAAVTAGAGDDEGLSQEDLLGWSAVLRSCSAWDAYKAQNGSEVHPEHVVSLLILDADFPRSMRFCVQHLNTALRRMSGVPDGRFSNEAEKLCGRLLAELQFCAGSDLYSKGLHESIDELQAKLGEIGHALFQTYIAQHFALPDGDELRQQEEQQQQAPELCEP